VVVYAVVIGSTLIVLGPQALAGSVTPLADAVDAGDLGTLEPLVRAGAVVASLSVLLSLLAGVSRTALAMARERDLPRQLSAVHPRWRTPVRAELAIGLVVAVLAATLDLRSAIGFSSFAVLFYYAVANASAWTLPSHARRWPRWVPVVGLAGCATLALSLRMETLIAAAVLFGAGITWYVARIALSNDVPMRRS
jgi:APA family basic amino acid/polyamine antiporter